MRSSPTPTGPSRARCSPSGDQKYNRIDGFTSRPRLRGSGTGIQLEAAWKTYRGVKPILPKKVFVQARVDGGRWAKVSGARGKIGKRATSSPVRRHTSYLPAWRPRPSTTG